MTYSALDLLHDLALESKEAELEGFDQLFDFIGEDMTLESALDRTAPAKEAPRPVQSLPGYLYHGSMYKQDELMPGFKRSGQLVRWDKTEDNTWLYTSDNREDAVMLGISSAIEKKFLLDRYRWDKRTQTMILDISGPCKLSDIYKLDVYLYTLRGDRHDGWQLNFNPVNNIVGEYKTQNTIDGNVMRCEKIDIERVLRNVTVKINCSAGYSTESLADIVKGIKSFFGGGSRTQKKGHKDAHYSDGRVKLKEGEAYIRKFFANSSWVHGQEFNETVAAGGIAKPLSYRGTFNPNTALSTVGKVWKDTLEFSQVSDHVLEQADAVVQTVFTDYSHKILKELGGAADESTVESLTSEANKKFDAAVKKLTPLIGHKIDLLGSETVEVKADTQSYFGVAVRRVSNNAPDVSSIPALDADGVLQAAELALRIIADIMKEPGGPRWLDFEDDNPFWHKLQDFDESTYMDFGEAWYFQHVDIDFAYDLVSRSGEGDEILTALITWMDRSIK